MNVKERLKSFINKELKGNVSLFEKTLKFSNGYVNSISKGIGTDRLNLILENYSNLNVEWLITGKGNMLKSDSSDVQVKEVIKEVIVPDPACQEKLKDKEELLKAKDTIIKDKEKMISLLEEQILELKKTPNTLQKDKKRNGGRYNDIPAP